MPSVIQGLFITFLIVVFGISYTAIEHKTEARFLGVIIDATLNWTRHVKTVLSKM